MKLNSIATWFLAFCFICGASASPAAPDPTTEFPAPEFLSFDNLIALSKTAEPQRALGERLRQLLTTPFVRNDASLSGAVPHRPSAEELGPLIRAGFWNIERGLNFNLIRSALAGTADSGGDPIVERQFRRLKDSDVLLLNEVDLGMKRTDYRDVARDLAAALRMNYAFAVEFVEVHPLSDLGIERIDVPDKSVEQRVEEDLKADPDRYRGLHGNAVLSRYPIRHARIVRLPVCYDWYNKETQAIAKLETGRRWTARKLFRERIVREVRHGGRIALIVDLTVPDVPGGELTVVSVHLENKCPPGCRQTQITALLATLQGVHNPLVIAGDLNTSGGDATPLRCATKL
jgi:endonuclease/exonuclease/phosphatase family metal-dependent hydrolase